MIVILGATASGKTALGVELAKKRSGVVVSADSRQLYAGMNIGTAKPELINSCVDGVKHCGFDIREPNNQITLAEWQRAAFEMIDKIMTDGRTPILAGGTMLYIDSIVDNYDIPAAEPNEKLRVELAKESTEALYAELVKRDPPAKKFIAPHNKRRIIRALEVIKATGRPFSAQRRRRAPRYETKIIGLFPGWNLLRERIAERAEKMMREGLVEETRQLQERYGKCLPLLETINYKQAAAVLVGEMTESEAVAEMIKVNVRYARRQMSWWKHRGDISWFPNSESVFSEYQ